MVYLNENLRLLKANRTDEEPSVLVHFNGCFTKTELKRREL